MYNHFKVVQYGRCSAKKFGAQCAKLRLQPELWLVLDDRQNFQIQTAPPQSKSYTQETLPKRRSKDGAVDFLTLPSLLLSATDWPLTFTNSWGTLSKRNGTIATVLRPGRFNETEQHSYNLLNCFLSPQGTPDQVTFQPLGKYKTRPLENIRYFQRKYLIFSTHKKWTEVISGKSLFISYTYYYILLMINNLIH